MKSVLIIIPYDNIFPPMNGGMQRCFNLLNQLAIHFDVTAITHQEKNDLLESAKEYPAINNIKIYSIKDVVVKKDIFSLLPSKFENALRFRWIKKSFKNPADSLFLANYPLLKTLLKKNKFDVIILENLISLNAVSVIRKYDRSVRIIYDAHNVDSNLGRDAMTKFGMSTKALSIIHDFESNLYKTVNEIFACSETDRDGFMKLNRNQLAASVIPNGVAVHNLFEEGVQQDFPGYILFCGALWSLPNAEGLSWFYRKIWPQVTKHFPHLKLLVVGSGQLPTNYRTLVEDASLIFTGAVDDVKPWYNKAAIAIVPLLSGSGTRLKILEAMSLGLPVLSTTKGAEGIAYTTEEDIMIADTEKDFAEKVIHLLSNKQKRILISKAARKLVKEKYDWNVIGKTMADVINN